MVRFRSASLPMEGRGRNAGIWFLGFRVADPGMMDRVHRGPLFYAVDHRSKPSYSLKLRLELRRDMELRRDCIIYRVSVR